MLSIAIVAALHFVLAAGRAGHCVTVCSCRALHDRLVAPRSVSPAGCAAHFMTLWSRRASSCLLATPRFVLPAGRAAPSHFASKS